MGWIRYSQTQDGREAWEQGRSRQWNWVIECASVLAQVMKNGACGRSGILADPELVWEGGRGCEVSDRSLVCSVADARGPSKWKDNHQTIGNAKWKLESGLQSRLRRWSCLLVVVEVDTNSRSGGGGGVAGRAKQRTAARNRWFQGVLLFVLNFKKSEVSRKQFTSGIGI